MRFAPLLLVCVCGCQSYVQTQLDLAGQARRGVELCKASAEQRRGLVEELHAIRRQRLDGAFDEDVRQQQSLSPEWVIEHRRAYSAAADVLGKQAAASREADAVNLRNLEAIDAALQRIQHLQEMQLNLLDKLPKP